MKIFISYATRDGLRYATIAKEAFEQAGYEAWTWNHDGTLGASTWGEIADRIVNRGDLVFCICTPSSVGSYGQDTEIDIALNNRKTIIAVKVDEANVPVKLTGKNYGTWPGVDFKNRFKEFVADLPYTIKRIRSLGNSIGTTSDVTAQDAASRWRERVEYVRSLNRSIGVTDPDRVRKGREGTLSSYQEATIPRQVARLGRDLNPDAGFCLIDLWQMVNLDNFNDGSFWWGPYFSDMGRALAASEQDFLQKFIRERIGPTEDEISRAEPRFESLVNQIRRLSNNGTPPDVLFVPIDVYGPFVQAFNGAIRWEKRPELVEGRSRMKIFWSNRYAPSSNFAVFSSNAGIWHVVPDPDTGGAVTIAIGRSSLYPDKVEVGVQTLVKFEITQPEAFKVIDVR